LSAVTFQLPSYQPTSLHLQFTGLRAAKQALALFNFHHHRHQQPPPSQQPQDNLMVQWHNVDACDVTAGKIHCLIGLLLLLLQQLRDDTPQSHWRTPHVIHIIHAGVAILIHLAYFSLLCGDTVVIRQVHRHHTLNACHTRPRVTLRLRLCRVARATIDAARSRR
jgi:hypothetical protein